MSKRFQCTGCDHRPIYNECIVHVPNEASAKILGCVFGNSDGEAEWRELEPHADIEFDHSEDDVRNAVSGLDSQASYEIQRDMVSNPELYFGDSEKVSEVAEFILENCHNPNILMAISKLVSKALDSEGEE